MSLLYIGIDPGVHGGAVSLWSDAENQVRASSYSTSRGSDIDLWTWIATEVIKAQQKGLGVRVTLEQQIPRPTRFYDREAKTWRSSILRSTCVLYGHYKMIQGLLIAASISCEEVLPQRWQKAHGITPRKPGTTDSEWKNLLKARAQRLFPTQTITLANADAFLITEYGRLYKARD